MRVKYCFAPNCPSNTESEPGLTFHSLPSNERVLQQWAINMDREEKILNAPKSTQKHYFICGKHFLDSCFQTYERKKLNRGAIPTIFNITNDKKPLPNLKITNIYKKVSTKPIILNHQIVFPNVFENIEDAVQPMLPQLSQIPTKADIVQDPADLDATDQVKISVDSPELTSICCKSNENNISAMKIDEKFAEPEIPAGSVTRDLPNICEDSVEQLLSNMFDGSKDTPNKSSVKVKNGNKQIKVKPSKKYIRRMLMKAKKNILILQKCEGSCMQLFNKHDTIFNSKIIRNLEKLDQMPAVVKTYMNYQAKKINKTKCVKYKKCEIPFYTALYISNKHAYQFLLKIFNLPSTRKLKDFLKNTKFYSGLNSIFIGQLKRNSMLLSPLDRYCSLLFKRIRLCPFLSYNIETDTTEGLQINGSERTCYIINECFIFFLSGLHKAWKQPVAYYFVSNQTKSLHNCIKEVISEIHEKTNFYIVTSISSLNSTNINAIQHLMPVDSKDFIYKVNGHEVIHIFDPPSLLKMLRNHFINHDIAYDQNRVAKWVFLVKLFDLDGHDGAMKLTKLTSDHINPNKDQKRKTLLAAQLFSNTVSSCLRMITKLAVNDNFDTADFCLFVNNLFDSFNGTLIPKYNSKLLGRLNDSSSHFEFWKEAETTLSSLQFLNNETGKIYTSYVAYAFILNINNTKKLWIKLKNEGFKDLVMKHLNLDPLENFHAVMRFFYGKYSKHPTSFQFQESFKISLFNDKFSSPDSDCEENTAVFICPLKPEIFYSKNCCLIPLSNTRLISSAIYKMVQSVHLYSAENVAKFLTKKVLNYKCDICVKVVCSDNVRMIAVDNLIQEIKLLQREVYKKITRYLNQEQFIHMLYCFAEGIWNFDFICPQHKYEMKYKTITSICFIMVKCFIEIANKMLWTQSTKR